MVDTYFNSTAVQIYIVSTFYHVWNYWRWVEMEKKVRCCWCFLLQLMYVSDWNNSVYLTESRTNSVWQHAQRSCVLSYQCGIKEFEFQSNQGWNLVLLLGGYMSWPNFWGLVSFVKWKQTFHIRVCIWPWVS